MRDIPGTKYHYPPMPGADTTNDENGQSGVTESCKTAKLQCLDIVSRNNYFHIKCIELPVISIMSPYYTSVMFSA